MLTEDQNIKVKKVRVKVKELSPNSHQEYIRRKNRINKAKSRERQREQMKHTTLEEEYPMPEIQNEIVEMLKPNHVTPMSMYACTEEFLKVMFEQYPDFQWFFKNDPRTKSILQMMATREDCD